MRKSASRLFAWALGLTLIAAAGLANAQQLPLTKTWEIGDRLTYNMAIRGRSALLVEEVVAVNDREIRLAQYMGERLYDGALTVDGMARVRGMCHGAREACTWSPAEVWARFPLEAGKMWSERLLVTSDELVTDVVVERKVEEPEMVSTLAGRFEAFRITATERYASRRKNGRRASEGMAFMTYWIAAISDKPVIVKWEYRTSTGERFERELVSAALR